MLIMREETEQLLGDQHILKGLESVLSIKGSIMENIATVVEEELCTGCGTCVSVCPTGAIKMRVSKGLYLPEIEECSIELIPVISKYPDGIFSKEMYNIVNGIIYR